VRKGILVEELGRVENVVPAVEIGDTVDVYLERSLEVVFDGASRIKDSVSTACL
jgi:hypothetical protein